MSHTIKTSVTTNQIKEAYTEAHKERLDGYYEKGWHYPKNEECLFIYLQTIQEFLNIPNIPHIKPEDVKPIIKNAFEYADNIFGINFRYQAGIDDKPAAIDNMAVYLIAASLFEENLRAKNTLILDVPTI